MREGHLSFEEIVKYISTLEITKENQEEMYKIDLHIADCQECLEKIRFLRELDFAVDNWSAELQGDMYREKFKSKKDNMNVIHGKKVKDWVEQFFYKADAAVEIRVDDKEELLGEETYTTKIITGGMEKYLGKEHKYFFNSELSSVSRGRKVSYVEYGTEAVDEKSGSKIIVNTADEENRLIRIDLMDINPDKMPMIVLTDMEEKDVVFFAKESVLSEGKLSVKFSGISQGKYLLLIERV